ncbi:hypothetical protein TrLO_g9617, partial [Triparma laevis f. longispina]
DDVLPDGTIVKSGERVMFLIWCMARQKDIWGDGAEDFKPERFLGEEGKFKAPEGWKMPTFLAGKRTCLGKDMAMLSSSIMLLDFLDEFDVGGGEEAEVAYDTGLTLWSTTGMNIKVDARKN